MSVRDRQGDREGERVYSFMYTSITFKGKQPNSITGV